MVNCGEYPLPSHTRYIVNSGTMFNQTISVQCLPGFEPENITTATCQANGEWNNAAPNCTAGKSYHDAVVNTVRTTYTWITWISNHLEDTLVLGQFVVVVYPPFQSLHNCVMVYGLRCIKLRFILMYSHRSALSWSCQPNRWNGHICHSIAYATCWQHHLVHMQWWICLDWKLNGKMSTRWKLVISYS